MPSRVIQLKNVTPRQARLGRRRRVQGIDVDIDRLTLRGKRFRAVITDAITSADVARTIEGASTIDLGIYDPDHDIVNHPLLEQRFVTNLDGLTFEYLGVDDDGTGGLTMRFESEAVARLRRQRGHVKALRRDMTRAEFLLMLVRELKRRPIPFFCPELHVIQPIRNKREHRRERVDRDVRREPGFPPNANITVKGVKADSSQRRIAETILDVGMSLKANKRVLMMAIACATQESNMVDLGSGDYAHPDSKGPFGQWLVPYPEAGDLVKACRYFYLGNGEHFGIIEHERKNPKRNFSLTIADVQRPREDLRMEYQQWQDEAERTVELYLGGAAAGGGTIEQTKQIPYTFERKKKESTWACGTRLAEEVRWRWFENAGMIYYVADDYLMTSRVRMNVHDEARGIDVIRANYDSNMPVQEITIAGRARDWAAPPGTVVRLNGRGMADGRYLVKDVRASLFTPNVEITAVRPTPELPEPAAQTKTIRRDRPDGQGRRTPGRRSEAERMVKWALSNVGVGEGSAKQRKWAADVGYSSGDPWCSIFLAYGIKHVTSLTPPSGAGYSGAWFSWSDGSRISGNNLQPGDFIIYDWGDGGITDHVDLYVGDNQTVGGNVSNAVVKGTLSRSSVVGYVRPNYA